MDELIKRPREVEEMLKVAQFKEAANLIEQAADAIAKLSAYVELYKDLAEKNQQMARKLIEEKPRWIPVAEALPEENGYYLTYVESAIFSNSYYLNMIKFIDGDFVEDHCVIHRVTHWMPLPEPPKEEN